MTPEKLIGSQFWWGRTSIDCGWGTLKFAPDIVVEVGNEVDDHYRQEIGWMVSQSNNYAVQRDVNRSISTSNLHAQRLISSISWPGFNSRFLLIQRGKDHVKFTQEHKSLRHVFGDARFELVSLQKAVSGYLPSSAPRPYQLVPHTIDSRRLTKSTF